MTQPQDSHIPNMNESPPRILVADDDDDFRTLAKAYFGRGGWQVLTVENALRIETVLEESPVDVLLADVFMPGSDERLEVLIRVSERWPSLPIMVVTGNPSLPSAQGSVRARAFDYIAKPVDFTVLEERARAAADRHRLALALVRSENQHRTIFENTGTATILVDDDGLIVRANRQFARMMACAPSELEGLRNLGDFIAPADQAKWRYHHGHRRLNPTAIPRSYELTVTPRGGESKVVQASVSLVPDSNLRVCSLTDLSSRKRAEQAATAAARIDATATLAAGLAHELNNLMVVVLGNAQLLQEDIAGNRDATRMLDEMAGAARRAGQLTAQLTAFSRAGRVDARPTNLGALAERVVGMCRAEARPGAALRFNGGDDLFAVMVDEAQMTQVIHGLVQNAVEALADTGTVTVSTSNVRLDDEALRQMPGLMPGDHVRLSVTDDGSGMPADVRERIFEPFFSTRLQGRGLGLSAIYGIVKSHAGYIAVDSAPGSGTSVSVYLPAVTTAGVGASPAAAAPEARTHAGTGTILAVDDELVVLRVLARSLGRLGYTVLTAESAARGLELAREHDGAIDLAIVDLHMPGTDAVEMFGPLTKLRPAMPVLVSSGFDNDPRIDFLMHSGAVGFLRKPYTIEALGEAVRRALERQ